MGLHSECTMLCDAPEPLSDYGNHDVRLQWLRVRTKPWPCTRGRSNRGYGNRRQCAPPVAFYVDPFNYLTRQRGRIVRIETTALRVSCWSPLSTKTIIGGGSSRNIGFKRNIGKKSRKLTINKHRTNDEKLSLKINRYTFKSRNYILTVLTIRFGRKIRLILYTSVYIYFFFYFGCVKLLEGVKYYDFLGFKSRFLKFFKIILIWFQPEVVESENAWF